jgi:predicted dehydrogenase
MTEEIKVALIGLDRSYTVEFVRRMQASDRPCDQRIEGLRATACLRFPTPFYDEKGLATRQKLLENWGVRITSRFEDAVAGCGAVMIEINDPARHLEYFTRCAALGQRIFLDKPLADTPAGGRAIRQLARERNTEFFSASRPRFVPRLAAACAAVPTPVFAAMYGPLGQALAGSSIVWYGVHTFEMLQLAMGRGAESIWVRKHATGLAAVVGYNNNRHTVVELNRDAWQYGGCLHDRQKAVPFAAETGRMYTDLLGRVAEFFKGGPCPVPPENTLEIMATLDATQHSFDSGAEERLDGQTGRCRRFRSKMRGH